MLATGLEECAVASEEVLEVLGWERSGTGRGHQITRGLRRNPVALLAGLAFATIILLTMVGPFFSPYDPFAVDTSQKLLSPSLSHLLGTDDFGRDIWTRLLCGGRTTLFVGAAATLLSLMIGMTLGTIGGYEGGMIDSLIMRIVDVMLSFPIVLLATIIVVILGPGVFNVIVAVAVSQISLFARLSRSLTLAMRHREFVEAAVSVGATDSRILRAHILPNILAPIFVQGTSIVAVAMLNASALNFLGLGIQPPNPDWGAMINDFRRFLFDRPELPLYPGLALLATVLSLNLLGDGLIAMVDPTASQNLR